jgi:hypothetical protein
MDPLQKALQEAGALMVKTLQQELRKEKKSASGNLIKSISFKTTGNSITLSGLPYLKWVDQGRKPGKMPPPGELVKWVKDKKIEWKMTPEQMAWAVYKGMQKKGKFAPIGVLVDWVKAKGFVWKQKPEQIAWVIARSIGEKGIKPTNVIQKTRTKTKKQVSKIISNGFSQIAMQRVRDSFK